MELKTRRRKKREQLQAVFQDLKRLMALAFPGQMGPMAEITAIDAFVDALADRNQRKQVLQKSPSTLVEALTWAIRIEAIDESGSLEVAVADQGTRRKEKAFAHLAEAGERQPHQPLRMRSRSYGRPYKNIR